MLSVNKYKKEYIKECRSQINKQIAAYKRMSELDEGKDDFIEKTFEPLFFNNMIMVLDNYFVHRARGLEGKDGNPLNEVRMLCSSIMNNGGRLAVDSTIKYDPVNSVLKLKNGDKIKVNIAGFTKLSKAFFNEIELKFS